MMRLGVACSVGSPWARGIIQGLRQAGVDAQAIDFAAPDVEGYYLSVADPHQAESLRQFHEEVPVHHLHSRLRGNLRYATTSLDLRQLARTARLDALISLYGGGRALQLRMSGVRPYAVYIVGSDVLFATGLRAPMARWSLGGASLVVANGEHLAASARRLAPAVDVRALYIGVDTDTYAPPERRLPGPVRITCTRGFNPVYNNDYVIEALALLPESLDWTMTFTSGGPLQAAAAARTAVLLGERAGRVRFLGGVTAETLQETVRQSDIYVSCSRSDGTSVALLEALAAGVYPVLTDIPANREWIPAGSDDGAIVPLDDPARLAAAIAAAVDNGARRERARPRLRQLVQSRAEARTSSETLKRWLEEMVDRRRKLHAA